MADRPDDTSPDVPTEPAGPSRRKVQIGIGLVLLLVAITVAGVLSRENESNPVDDVASALAAAAPNLAGPLNPTALEHTRCVAAGEGRYSCTPVMDNATAKAITVEYKEGTSITKRLAGSTLSTPPKTGDAVAAALNADERAELGRTVKYGCAFTSGLNADGSANASSPGGFRCAAPTPGGTKDEFLQRYVEFAADGSVSRDFMIAGS